MAPAVHGAVEGEPVLAVGLGRDHRRGAARIEVRPKPIGVEGLVAEQGAEAEVLDQRRHADRVVALAGQQHEAREIAERIHEGHDLRGQAAARAADGLMPSPPLAPLAFWWAGTMVPSISAYSKSGSPDSRSNSRWNT